MITLKCGECGGTKQMDAQAVVGGVPVLTWFALRANRCTPCYVSSSARNTDPMTSRKAALGVVGRAGSQRHKVLMAFFDGSELTADEARQKSGLPERSCYWKRVSELREAGLIEPTGRERAGEAGSLQMVCRITQAGRILAGAV